MSKKITIEVNDSKSARRALRGLVESARQERDYFDGRGGSHGATAEAFERIAIAVETALAD